MSVIEENDSVEPLKDTDLLKKICVKVKANLFGSCEQLKKLCLLSSRVLRSVHTGSLSLYLFWFFWGWLIVFLLLKVKG